jgi:hypothetical protein
MAKDMVGMPDASAAGSVEEQALEQAYFEHLKKVGLAFIEGFIAQRVKPAPGELLERQLEQARVARDEGKKAIRNILAKEKEKQG